MNVYMLETLAHESRILVYLPVIVALTSHILAVRGGASNLVFKAVLLATSNLFTLRIQTDLRTSDSLGNG